MAKTDKQKLTEHILQTVEQIYNMFGPVVPQEWLSSDITVTQLRILLVLRAAGPSRMSDIASKIGVTLPTATVIVRNLVRKNLVQREVSPEDRRLVICKLTTEGLALIEKIWGFSRFAIRALLDGLTTEQLQNAVNFADQLLKSAETLGKNIK
ncbi:MAG: MarR family transcriptional regulator [Dehalococcoidales bacterium]|nr:MarR family transcriptional regulator [Dehalococcoidales bacterium]